MSSELPVIDVGDLVHARPARAEVARRIAEACRAHGFFYVTGHGVSLALMAQLETLSRQLFAFDEATKLRWRMALDGRARRGYFPLGGELTSGRPDWKDGLYLGTELPHEDALVRAGTPVHGRNLLPSVPDLRDTMLAYMAAVTRLGHRLMEGMALSLALPPDHFAACCIADPLILFRLFNYPSRAVPEGNDAQWGVGEHSDYGLLTILLQNDVGGLEVKTRDGWTAAPPIPGIFVCNIGDMLDRMTGGLYRSAPHRVAINHGGRDRLSFPLFFEPNFFNRVQRIEGLAGAPTLDDSAER